MFLEHSHLLIGYAERIIRKKCNFTPQRKANNKISMQEKQLLSDRWSFRFDF